MYKKIFIFNEDSNTFFDIMYRAARDCLKINNPDPASKVVIDAYYEEDSLTNDDLKRARERFRAAYSSAYQNIVIEKDTQTYTSLIQNLSFYGAIEKDFSTIISPRKAGNVKFWRLVNYFWSAFFSILKPLLERTSRYPNAVLNNDFYLFAIQHLFEIIDYIYNGLDFTDDTIDYQYADGINYYLELRQLNPYCVLTTNYTPFARSVFGNQNTVFLSGELSRFELPRTLETIDLSKNQIPDDVIVFPYILTQAPLKPIVEPYQMRQYAKALEYLDSIDVLVMIGYSLCENDNHINAMIRNFIKENGRKLIYFEYNDDLAKYDQDNVKNKVLDRLKLSDKYDSGNYLSQVVVAPIIPSSNADNIRDIILMNTGSDSSAF